MRTNRRARRTTKTQRNAQLWEPVLADIARSPTRVIMADTIGSRRARYASRSGRSRGAIPVQDYCAGCGVHGWIVSDTRLCVNKCEFAARFSQRAQICQRPDLRARIVMRNRPAPRREVCANCAKCSARIRPDTWLCHACEVEIMVGVRPRW